MEKLYKIFMKFVKFFYEISIQKIDKTYERLLPQVFESLLHLSKLVLANCDLSTNRQKSGLTND